MWFTVTWKKMRFCDWRVSFAVWIVFSSFLPTGGMLTIAQQDFPENIPPAPEGPEGLDAVLASSSTNILQFPLRNFTKVATIKYNNTKTNVNYSLKNLKKPSFLFTLNLNLNRSNQNVSKDQNLQEIPTESSLPEVEATTALITDTLSQINQSVNETLKTISILDRLRNLTNLKLKGRGSGTRFGVKSFGKVDPVIDTLGKNSSQIKYGIDKLNPSASQLVSTTTTTEPADSSTNTNGTDPTTKDQTPMSMIGGHILMTSSSSPIPKPFPRRSLFQSTTPIVLKVGTLSKNSLYSNSKYLNLTSTSANESDSINDENIKTGETRVAITADQLSGNRPTKTPFHFTSEAPTTPPPTTTVRERGQINRYQRPHSPHNHAFSPTQDPVSIAHNEEDLSVEDFQDFRVANLVFGSKVGAEVSTLSPQPRIPSTGSRPRPTTYQEDDDDDDDDDQDDEGALPVRTLQQNTRGRPSVQIATPAPTTRPPQVVEQRKPPKFTPKFLPKTPKKSPPPLSASSGVKNAHIKLQNQNNDNLPFYKEPGGVFKEHKYTHGDQDDESNQISHNSYSDRSPAVKYAPKVPTAQPQTVYPNHRQQAPYQNPNQGHHHQLGGHVVHQPVIQQQPVYIQPVQMQQHQLGLYPGFGYTSQQPQLQQLPQQRPTQAQNSYFQVQPVAPTPYYPVAPQQPLFATQVTGFVPLQQHQQQQQHHQIHQSYPAAQPIAAPPVQPRPVYHSRDQEPKHGYNNRNNDHFNNYGPSREERDENGNFPSRSDPDSDSFYGDPRPDTSSSVKSEPRKPIPPPPRKPQINNQSRKKQQGKKTENSRKEDEDEEEEEEEPEDEEPEEDRRESRPSPPPPPPRRPPPRDRDRKDQSERNVNRNGDRNDDRNNEDYDEEEEPPKRGDGGDGRDNRQNNYKNQNNNNPNNRDRDRGNRDRRPQYNRNNEDYDGDYFEPNNNNPKPVFNEIPNGPHGDYVDLGNNFGNPTGRRQPFKPSPVDSGPVRPSNPDFRPNFDHPNIQYPNNRGSSNNHRPISHNHNNQNRGPDYDPRGFGVGFGPSPGNVHLDPIYTRTIKQFDEEQTKPQQNNNRRPPQREEPSRGDRRGPGNRNRDEEHHDEQDEERPRRVQGDEDDRQRPQGHDDDEERPRKGQDDDEERPQRGHDDEEERPRRGQDDEEERPRRGQDDEEERPRRGQDDEEERPQKVQKDDEEERPEAEDEEEEPPPKGEERGKKDEKEEEPEEEEEEEEEEEAPKKPLGNRQRKGSKDGQEKKPPPKKPPPQEKSGDLEEDIRGIEREFGGFGEFP